MNSEQAANILAFYSYYHPKESVDEIAVDFKVPVSIIVNALYYGDREGLFQTKKKGPQFKEITVPAIPDANADFGPDMEKVKARIFETVSNVNSDGQDITDYNLFIWLGVPLIIAKVGLRLLVNEGKLVKYFMVDTKDKSKYHFYTLTENKDKRYGSKQFKKTTKKGKKNVKLSRRKR